MMGMIMAVVVVVTNFMGTKMNGYEESRALLKIAQELREENAQLKLEVERLNNIIQEQKYNLEYHAD